jgi:hypothetical protein
MYCIICKKDVKGGVVSLQLNGAFLTLGSLDPDDYETYKDASGLLKSQGWEECIVCNKCKQII